MDHLSFFNHIVGADYVLQTSESLVPYLTDWTKIELGQPLCVLKPSSTSELSKIMAYCFEHQLPVVPTGGRTGLAGGAAMTQGCVGISVERMNRVLSIDSVGCLVKTEAGITTQKLQEEVDKHGLFYGVDLGARGSCQIGGNIATNAGGLKYIRHAGTREQLLGVEVVLADGTVLDLNRDLYKNNIGFNLMHLIVGSEGTLGIVTQATLKLHSKPSDLLLCCLAVRKFEDVLEIFQLTRKFRLCLTAFEFFTDKAAHRVRRNKKDLPFPFAYSMDDIPFYALIECESEMTPQGIDAFVEECFARDLAFDGVVPTSQQEFKNIWNWRELITESLAATGHVRKNDLCLPHAELDRFVKGLAQLKKLPLWFEFVLFGHIGDGNIHLNYHAYKDLVSKEEFSRATDPLEKEVYDLVAQCRGSISAEHGVGYLKRDDLLTMCSKPEIEYMKKIKQIFDPKGILNPGKLLV